MELTNSILNIDSCSDIEQANISLPVVPSPPPPTPQKSNTMRRHRVSARHRAPTRMAREKLLEKVLASARAKRCAAVDARRAARVLAKRRDLFDVDDDFEEPVELTDEQIDTLLAEIEAEVESDRRDAEQAELERYEREGMGEIEELLAFQSLSIDDSFVKCPACTTGGLLVREGVVVCNCGLRVNCGSLENVTPDIVRQRLADVHTKHERCGGMLKFESKHLLDSQFLLMRCFGCNAEEIVL